MMKILFALDQEEPYGWLEDQIVSCIGGNVQGVPAVSYNLAG